MLLHKSFNFSTASLKVKMFMSTRSMASKTPVGFIGLGNMGSPMARNLLKNGYPVIATDVFPESCKELQDLGAQVVDSPSEVAEKADRIITMLPSSPNVIEVYTGPNGILKKVKKGTLLIDSSTIDPAVSKEMAVAAEKMGAVFMDAPVSGGNVSPKELVNKCVFVICCLTPMEPISANLILP
uniref:3-hydroxyisobutyrate dehydrogenase, mitochondrial-like n=1 Tax=Seriola lalandi dorsalis TaxID=1841481 RepID=A0A3B4WY75_SERLL